MAVISLVVGLAIGYLFRGSQSPAAPPPQPAANAQSAAPAGAMGRDMPSLKEMKQMADKKAAPLLEKLKTDPNNSGLLIQVGKIYSSTHQFKEAASYYGKALQVDPKNVAIRTEMASCLYYNGDVDEAISQLQQSLHYDPKDANSLFNLGMIKWQGKQDSKGALAAWQQLLKANPQLSAERKATVQKLMADVQMQGKS
jgi:cytochrome c-type biogenesis protein CcmH/NrfG